MLKLTKKSDYGLIAMKHLAELSPHHAGREGGPTQVSCSAKDLADAHGIPQELLAKILQRLVKAGLLISQHGTNGGYVLARDAAAISAFQVIQAIEGPPFITACVSTRGCGRTEHCTVREPLQKVRQSIEEVLSRITISDLKESGHESELVSFN